MWPFVDLCKDCEEPVGECCCKYTGPNLPASGVNTGDTFDEVTQKLDQTIFNALYPITTTSTTTRIVDTCDMILQADVPYLYSVSPRRLQEIVIPNYVFGVDIATTANKLWNAVFPVFWYPPAVPPPTYRYYTDISEYDIIYAPWTAIPTRTIRLDTFIGVGLCAIDNNTLVVVDEGTYWPSYQSGITVGTVDISGAYPYTIVPKFEIPADGSQEWRVSGDYLLTSSAEPKLIIALKNQIDETQTRLRQYDWATGNLEIDLDISVSARHPWGLGAQGNKLYLVNSGDLATDDAQVYEVALTYPYDLTLSDTLELGSDINGASQQPACINVEMITTTTTTTVI